MSAITTPTTTRFHRYSLDLLPADTFLVLDQHRHIASIINEKTCMPVAQEALTKEEVRIFCELLGHYPYHCPYENLYACVFSVPLDDARDTLQDAFGTPDWQYLMHPIQNNTSRTRLKLRPLGIEIRSMIDTGYVLASVRVRFQREKGLEG
jgi:hypothetical protein